MEKQRIIGGAMGLLVSLLAVLVVAAEASRTVSGRQLLAPVETCLDQFPCINFCRKIEEQRTTEVCMIYNSANSDCVKEDNKGPSHVCANSGSKINSPPSVFTKCGAVDPTTNISTLILKDGAGCATSPATGTPLPGVPEATCRPTDSSNVCDGASGNIGKECIYIFQQASYAAIPECVVVPPPPTCNAATCAAATAPSCYSGIGVCPVADSCTSPAVLDGSTGCCFTPQTCGAAPTCGSGEGTCSDTCAVDQVRSADGCCYAAATCVTPPTCGNGTGVCVTGGSCSSSGSYAVLAADNKCCYEPYTCPPAPTCAVGDGDCTAGGTCSSLKSFLSGKCCYAPLNCTDADRPYCAIGEGTCQAAGCGANQFASETVGKANCCYTADPCTAYELPNGQPNPEFPRCLKKEQGICTGSAADACADGETLFGHCCYKNVDPPAPGDKECVDYSTGVCVNEDIQCNTTTHHLSNNFCYELRPNDYTCRISTAFCDLNTQCTGTSTDCPPTQQKPLLQSYKCGTSLFLCGTDSLTSVAVGGKVNKYLINGAPLSNCNVGQGGVVNSTYAKANPTCTTNCAPLTCPNNKALSNVITAYCPAGGDGYNCYKTNAGSGGCAAPYPDCCPGPAGIGSKRF